MKKLLLSLGTIAAVVAPVAAVVACGSTKTTTTKVTTKGDTPTPIVTTSDVEKVQDLIDQIRTASKYSTMSDDQKKAFNAAHPANAKLADLKAELAKLTPDTPEIKDGTLDATEITKIATVQNPLTAGQIDSLVEKVKNTDGMTITDEAGLRTALAHESLTTVGEFKTGSFVTLDADAKAKATQMDVDANVETGADFNPVDGDFQTTAELAGTTGATSATGAESSSSSSKVSLSEAKADTKKKIEQAKTTFNLSDDQVSKMESDIAAAKTVDQVETLYAADMAPLLAKALTPPTDGSVKCVDQAGTGTVTDGSVTCVDQAGTGTVTDGSVTCVDQAGTTTA